MGNSEVNKKLEKKAKKIAKSMTIEKVDQFNWRMKEDLTGLEVIEAMRTLAHFISIPSHVLNEEETKMFDEKLFEKINVSNKGKKD